MLLLSILTLSHFVQFLDCKNYKIKDFVEKVSNFNATCSYENTGKENKPLIGVEILKVVQCGSPSARSNYKLKHNPKQIRNKNAVIDGVEVINFGVLSQNAATKNELFCRLCFETLPKEIASLEATFKHSRLEGNVKAVFEDGTNLLSFAVDNQLVGLLRFFHPNGTFINATSVSPDISSIFSPRWGYYVIPSEKEKVLLTKNFDDIFLCVQLLDPTFFQDCQEVRIESFETSKDGCSLKNIRTEMESEEVFNFYIPTEQRWYKNSKKQNPEHSVLPMRRLIWKWKNSYITLENPFWFGDLSREPFVENERKIRIYFPDLVGRTGFQRTWLEILSLTNVKLFDGFMYDGVFETEVDLLTARSKHWKLPIKIHLKIRNDHSTSKHDIVVYGKLHHGQLEGLVFIIGTLSADRNRCAENTYPGIGFIGRYRNGVPTGYCWKELVGHCWLYGKVDNEGHFSGNETAFIHQDMSTAYFGEFQKGIMISGQESELKSLTFDDYGLLVAEFTAPSGPFYHYSPPNETNVGDQSLLRDPIDKKYTEIGSSRKYSSAGESVFAKIDIPENTVVALMSGIVWGKAEENIFLENHKQLKKQYRTVHPKIQELTAYRITIPFCNLHLTVTPEFRSLKNFSSTTAHKVNHSFENNCVFFETETARFGILPSVISKINITAGEELLSSYLYNFETSPFWYRKLLVDHLEKHPEDFDSLEKIRSGLTVEEMKADIMDQEEYFRINKVSF